MGSASGEGWVTPPAISAPTTCSPASSSGSFTPCRSPASSATTRGRKTPTSTPAAPTTGARCRSTRSVASCTSRPGSATYDFYGADRHGMNLFANCLLALDVRTGQAAVALPDGPSRSVGSRQRRRRRSSITVQPQRPPRRRRGARRQDRFPVRLQSRDRRAALADRRAAGAEERRARRAGLADAAVPDQAAAVREDDVHASTTSIRGC